MLVSESRRHRPGAVRPSPLFPHEAQQLLADGSLQQAMEVCRQGLVYFPDQIAGYMILSQIFLAMGQRDRAANVLRDGYRRTGAPHLDDLHQQILHQSHDSRHHGISHRIGEGIAQRAPSPFARVADSPSDTAHAQSLAAVPLRVPQPPGGVSAPTSATNPDSDQPAEKTATEQPAADAVVVPPFSALHLEQENFTDGTATAQAASADAADDADAEIAIGNDLHIIATIPESTELDHQEIGANEVLAQVALSKQDHPEVMAEAESEVEVEMKTEVQSETEIQSETEVDVEIESESDVETEVGAETEVGIEDISSFVDSVDSLVDALILPPVPPPLPDFSLPSGTSATAAQGVGEPTRETITPSPLAPAAQADQRAIQLLSAVDSGEQGGKPASNIRPISVLAIHKGSNVSRLRSANLRLIPGLEFAPLRHEEPARKQAIAPLINQPMPGPELPGRAVPLPPIVTSVSASGAATSVTPSETGAVFTLPTATVVAPLPPLQATAAARPHPPSLEPLEHRGGVQSARSEEKKKEGGERSVLQSALRKKNVSHPADAPNVAMGQMTPLEELAKRLESARIPVVEDEEHHRPVPFEPSIVSDTLANILVAQGAYAEALKAFQTLARTKPERFDYYKARIADMKRRLSQQPPLH